MRGAPRPAVIGGEEGTMPDTPFESIESAHEYVRLLRQEVRDVEREVLDDVSDAERMDVDRRLDALRLVAYKLNQLGDHLDASSRILNDLRVLRRLLLGERARLAASPRSERAAV
jgi:hypothetical protein